MLEQHEDKGRDVEEQRSIWCPCRFIFRLLLLLGDEKEAVNCLIHPVSRFLLFLPCHSHAHSLH